MLLYQDIPLKKETTWMSTPLSRLPNRKQRQQPAFFWVDPITLLHPDRLDIAAKALYANVILGRQTQHSGVDAEHCYLKHIMYRTGGKEPGDEQRKHSLHSFQQQFIELIQSMRQHGFLEEYAIPVSKKTGLILNGAHRLAAALILGLRRVPVIYNTELDGLTWNAHWFITQGFTPKEVDELTRVWISLKRDHAGCIMLWPTLQAHWSDIENDIHQITPIVYQRTISLTKETFAELVRDIYATDWGPIPGENIENKIKLFSNYKPCIRFLVISQSEKETLKKLKQSIREQWHHIIPSDKFASIHTTDTERETAYIADLILNRDNLSALEHRAQGIRPEFLNWLSTYHQKLCELQIDPEHCCIVGSSVLEAYGIRNATDVDFTLTHALREKLFTGGVTHLSETLDVVAKDYPRAKVGENIAPNDQDLIYDKALHIRFRGLKFANLDVVVNRKQTQRRFKDLMDVALVGRDRFNH